MIKFDKLKNPMRNYVITSDIYDVDGEGYVIDGGRRIDYDELLTQMVYAERITPEQAEAEEQNYIKRKVIQIDDDALSILKGLKKEFKYKVSYADVIRELKHTHDNANKKYNGWSNYETWDIKLWIDSEPGSYEHWREQTQEILKNAKADNTFSKEENAALTLMHMLKDEIEENTPTATGYYADLLNAAISEINFHEIAVSMINDME